MEKVLALLDGGGFQPSVPLEDATIPSNSRPPVSSSEPSSTLDAVVEAPSLESQPQSAIRRRLSLVTDYPLPPGTSPEDLLSHEPYVPKPLGDKIVPDKSSHSYVPSSDPSVTPDGS